MGDARNLVESYLETPSAKRRQVNSSNDGGSSSIQADAILRTIALESYAHLSAEQGTNLGCAIISDLVSTDCSWSGSTRLCAIRALKELSRLPGPSRSFSKAEIVHALVTLAGGYEDYNKNLRAPDVTADEQHDLLLKTLNNVLLQHEEARTHFCSTSEGVCTSLRILSHAGSTSAIFLAARLLFFATLVESRLIRDAVEKWDAVSIFVKTLESLLKTEKQLPEVESAITELEKAFFNISLYYPRLAHGTSNGRAILGEEFHDALLPFLGPTIKILTQKERQASARLISPYSNAISVLLNFPVKPYKGIWSEDNPYGAEDSTSSSDSQYSSTPSTSTISTDRAIRAATKVFRRVSTKDKMKQGKVSGPPVLGVLMKLLDTTCRKYFASHDVDDGSASAKALCDGLEVEVSLEPALLLLRKLSHEVPAYRQTIKSQVLPLDIDRSVGLNERNDFLGILIRLMSSISFPRLARASGELLMSLCGGEAEQMVAEIGYGPCAGFLVNTGQSHVLPKQHMPAGEGSTRPSQKIVDPITGKSLPSFEDMKKQDMKDGVEEMTEEEKEAEAERLFTLFDRMEKNGIVKLGHHPIQQAVESGKIQDIDEEFASMQASKELEEDKEVETTVEREMKAFREKNKRRNF